jgi:PAS domain S-box-containing protein
VSDPNPRLVLDLVGEAVLAGDRTGRITYANAAVETVLGWKPGELVGKPLTAIIPPSLRGRHTAGFNRYRSTWVPRVLGRRLRVPALRRDGREVRIELTLSAFRGRGGEELYVATLHDAGPLQMPSQPATGRGYLAALAMRSLEGASELNDQRFADRLSEVLARSFGAVQVRLWLHDEATGVLRLGTRGGPMAALDEPPEGSLSPAGCTSYLASAASQRTPVILSGGLGEAPFDRTWLETHRVATAAVLPLVAGDSLQGVLVYLSDEPASNELADGLSVFAAQVAAALRERDHQAMIAERNTLRAQAAAFSDIAAGVARGTDRAELIDRVVERALALTVADHASLQLYDASLNGYLVHACAGYGSPIRGMVVPDGLGVTHAVIQASATVVLDDYQGYPLAVPKIRQRGVRSAAGAPVRSNGNVTGALQVESKQAGRTFGPAESQVLETFADLTSLLLDR